MIAARLARFLARPAVVDWLIAHAERTPYSDIVVDGQVYMRRFWLFNPYTDEGRVRRWSKYLPSVRLHHIILPDPDHHMHDHPWNARTFILRGIYAEVRQAENPEQAAELVKHGADGIYLWRHAGTTARLDFGQYHRITRVTAGGVWTLFVTYRYRGTWGFLVDDVKVKWRTYLGIPDKGKIKCCYCSGEGGFSTTEGTTECDDCGGSGQLPEHPCRVAPAGWRCKREAGHAGPCAALEGE